MSFVDKKELEKFNRYWEDLFEEFPPARVAAVAAMGKAVKGDLDANIVSQGVDDIFYHIRNSQAVDFGSKGGYAALRPGMRPMVDRWGKAKTWREKQVSTRQVTKWLERGHGTRRAVGIATRSRAAAKFASRIGVGYVKGRLFYSWTRMKAWEHAKKAANEVLDRLADLIPY